jgi:hypothetical protein
MIRPSGQFGFVIDGAFELNTIAVLAIFTIFAVYAIGAIDTVYAIIARVTLRTLRSRSGPAVGASRM